MGYVFISYSHKDKAYIQTLREALERHGIPTWVDDHIVSGARWAQVIQEKLEGCAALVLVMTHHAQRSEWVQNELNWAINENKPVFPLLVEGKLWLSVASRQFEDVTSGKLPPQSFFTELGKLVKTAGLPAKGTASEQQPADRDPTPIQVNRQAPASFQTAMQHLEKENTRLAFDALSQAIEENPQYAPAYRERAKLWDTFHQDQAIDDLTRAIELDPLNAETYYLRGVRYVGMPGKELDELADLTQAIERGNYLAAYLLRSETYKRLNMPAEAEADRRRYEELTGVKIKTKEVQPTAKPRRPSEGKGKAAQPKTRKRQTTAAIAPLNAEGFFFRGKHLLEQEKYTAAGRDLKRAIDMDPTLRQAYIEYAKVKFHQSDWAATTDLLSRYLQLEPQDVSILGWRAQVAHLFLKDPKAALADHTRCIELEPGNAAHYANRADLYRELFDYRAALADYSRCIELEPTNADHYADRAEIYKGFSDLRAALADCDRAIEIDPERWIYYQARSEIHKKMGMEKEAEKDRLKATTKILYGDQTKGTLHK